MRRINKKVINLNKLKTGCSPCMKQVKIMEQKISQRDISEINNQEFKKIVSSLFRKELYLLYLEKIKFDVKFSDLNVSLNKRF